jgi:hypothetical protein
LVAVVICTLFLSQLYSNMSQKQGSSQGRGGRRSIFDPLHGYDSSHFTTTTTSDPRFDLNRYFVVLAYVVHSITFSFINCWYLLFYSDSEDVVTVSLETRRGFNEDSPLWSHFHAIVDSIYNSMSYSHASMLINDQTIDQMNADFETKIKVVEKKADSMESEINKLRQTLAIVSGTLAKELDQGEGKDE